MKIQVLGSYGSVAPGQQTAAFLLDRKFLLDAGTISLSLRQASQLKITHIFITHAHLDHLKGLPFFLDNLMMSRHQRTFTVLSGPEVIRDIRRHLFNNRIWPDFSVLPTPSAPLIRYQSVPLKGFLKIDGYRIYAARVNHTVPAYGYMIEDPLGDAVIYTGDTGPTEKIWRLMAGHRVGGLIIEVSFPNSQEELARVTRHLTPRLLDREIRKMPFLPKRIWITHLKFHYRKIIEKEISRMPWGPAKILSAGMRLSV